MFCIECGEEIADQVNFCPVCGADQRGQVSDTGKKIDVERAKKTVTKAVGTVAAFGGAAALNIGKRALYKPTEKAKKKTEKKIGEITNDVAHEILVALKIEKRTPLEKLQKKIKKRKK